MNNITIVDHSKFNNELEVNIGNNLKDFDICPTYNNGSVLKVLSKKNKKVYALKKINIKNNSNIKNQLNELITISHPHLIKYYNYFEDNKNLYIILEYLNNNIKTLIDSNKIFDRPIKEEIVWNIFLQTSQALSYIHSKNIIHKNITSSNILLNDNLLIKISNFELPERINDKIYTKIDDILALGKVFYEICNFHPITENKQNEKYYSKEIFDIINILLNKNKQEKNKITSEFIYNEIKVLYSKKYIKIFYIESILSGMSSFSTLSKHLIENKNLNQNNTPISFEYLKYLTAINLKNNLDKVTCINNFREILINEKLNNQNNEQMFPKFFLIFLIENLIKESNKIDYTINNTNEHYIFSNSNTEKMDKVEMLIKFINEYKKIINSFVADMFLGLFLIENSCQTCNIKTYSFNNFYFINFDIDLIAKKEKTIDLKEYYITKAFNFYNNFQKFTNIYCDYCMDIKRHIVIRKFYCMPMNLIIYVNRGIRNNIKTKIIFEENINLESFVEYLSSPKQFRLAGVILKNKNEQKEENYYYLCKLNDNINWVIWKNGEYSEIKERITDINGEVILLFYNLKEN